MFSQSPVFARPEGEITHKVRAKFSMQPDGSKRLLSIQEFTQPMFRESGYEVCDRFDVKKLLIPEETDCATPEDVRQLNIQRAVRRAKVSCFDILECNPDMDAFATMTISPEAATRTSWEECYGLMRSWLSNRVQRRDLKYVVVPEHHADGKSIHFHAVMNSEALRMERARSPTGRLIYRDKKPVFNMSDCDFGYSTVMTVEGESAQDKVAKYIFKYMGKQLGQGARIGGRYYLHGGRLRLPVYEYADDVNDVLPENLTKTPILHQKSCEITQNLKYRELYFV